MKKKIIKYSIVFYCICLVLAMFFLIREITLYRCKHLPINEFFTDKGCNKEWILKEIRNGD